MIPGSIIIAGTGSTNAAEVEKSMLRNNRPYTNENGFVDSKLITDFNFNEITTVMEWIRKNIRPSDAIYPRTSYGLKHMLEDDTHLYLTNNQMKDALYLAGFKPVDPDELNWSFRICFPRELIYNPSPFVKWLRETHLDEDTPYGDFTKDVVYDPYFPIFADHSVIREYFEDTPSSEWLLEIFEELWNEYKA